MACDAKGKPFYGGEIIKDPTYDSEKGIWMGDAAAILVRFGYKVKMFIFNLWLLDEKEFGLSTENKLELIRQRKMGLEGKEKEAAEVIERGLKAGVEFVWQAPTWETIKGELDKNNSVIVGVIPAALYRYLIKKYNGHAVIVSGYDGNKVEVMNPTRNTPDKMLIEYLIIGITARYFTGNSGWGMVIE